MDALVAQLSSSKPFAVRLVAATEIRTRLCKAKAPFDEVIAAGLEPLVALLTTPTSPGDSTKLQLEAAWALSNITASQHKRHTASVVASHAVPALASMISVELPAEVRELSLLCLANIAGENEEYRDRILRSDFVVLHRGARGSANVVVLLRNALSTFTTLVPESFLKTAAHLCRSLTSGTAPLPQMADVEQLLPVLKIFLRSKTAVVLEDSLSSVANLAGVDGMRPLLADFVGRLIELVEHRDASVTKQAVRALGCLAKGDVPPPQLLLPAFLTKIVVLLAKKDVVKVTLQLISVLCGGPPKLVASCFATPGLLPGVMKALDSNDALTARLGCAVLSSAVRSGTNETTNKIFFAGKADSSLASLKKILTRDGFAQAKVAAMGVVAELAKPHEATVPTTEHYYAAKWAAREKDSHFDRFGVAAPDKDSAAFRKRAMEKAGLPEVIESVRDAAEADDVVGATARALLEENWPYISFERASDSDGEDGLLTACE